MRELYRLSEDLVPCVEANYLTEAMTTAYNAQRDKYIKIIKAVKAWAEANDIKEVRYYFADGYGCQFEAGYGFLRICFDLVELPFMVNGETYKIIRE